MSIETNGILGNNFKLSGAQPLEKIVNHEDWRGPERFFSVVCSAFLLAIPLSLFDRYLNDGTEQNAIVRILAVVGLFSLWIFANVKLRTSKSSYTYAVEITRSNLTITQHEARTVWQRATVKRFEFPITAIRSAKLVFQDAGENPNWPHLSLSIQDVPIGCPTDIVFHASQDKISRFLRLVYK